MIFRMLFVLFLVCQFYTAFSEMDSELEFSSDFNSEQYQDLNQSESFNQKFTLLGKEHDFEIMNSGNQTMIHPGSSFGTGSQMCYLNENSFDAVCYPNENTFNGTEAFQSDMLGVESGSFSLSGGVYWVFKQGRWILSSFYQATSNHLLAWDNAFHSWFPSLPSTRTIIRFVGMTVVVVGAVTYIFRRYKGGRGKSSSVKSGKPFMQSLYGNAVTRHDAGVPVSEAFEPRYDLPDPQASVSDETLGASLLRHPNEVAGIRPITPGSELQSDDELEELSSFDTPPFIQGFKSLRFQEGVSAVAHFDRQGAPVEGSSDDTFVLDRRVVSTDAAVAGQGVFSNEEDDCEEKQREPDTGFVFHGDSDHFWDVPAQVQRKKTVRYETPHRRVVPSPVSSSCFPRSCKSHDSVREYESFEGVDQFDRTTQVAQDNLRKFEKPKKSKHCNIM